MAHKAGGRWQVWAVLELGLYLAVAGSFLWTYVGHFDAPLSVVFPHLRIIFSALLLPLGLRVLIGRFLPVTHISNGLVTMLMVVPMAALLLWYILVLVGLSSWGRVTTWELIRTYASQAPFLLDVLGISQWVPTLLIFAIVVATLGFVYLYVAPNDWTRVFVGRATSASGALIPLALMAMSVIHVASFLKGGGEHPAEPVALSLIPKKSYGLQSHNVEGSTVLDAREDRARHAYVSVGPARKRNLVLIVGDALRASHMSAYGYGRDTTPGLKALIARHDNAVVTNVRASCAESSCGLMALASSRPVTDIGAAPFTLQEVMRRAGYGVHFVLSGDHTHFYGLREMYGPVDSYYDGSSQRRRYMNDDRLVVDRLDQFPDAVLGKPVALQVHLMSAHGLGQRRPDCSPYQPSSNYYAWPGSSPKRPGSDQEAEYAVNYYDNGVRCLDDALVRTLSLLGKL